MSLDPQVPKKHGATKADICECTGGVENKLECATDTSKSPSLVSLPTEIHLLIFEILDLDGDYTGVVTSICLGLTCKAFYPLHVAKHGLSSLIMPSEYRLLENWIGPDKLFDFDQRKFVKKAYPGQTQEDIDPGWSDPFSF